MMNRLVLYLALTVLCSCKQCKESSSGELCSNKETFEGNALKLDGYYYLQFDDSPARREIIFLYRDGTLLYGGMIYLDQLQGVEESYMNGTYYNLAKENENDWGNFRISGGWIAYEKWYPSTNNQLAYVRDGEVLNDSTFHIVKSYRCNGSEQRSENEIYKFKYFPNKPDSANQFVQ